MDLVYVEHQVVDDADEGFLGECLLFVGARLLILQLLLQLGFDPTPDLLHTLDHIDVVVIHLVVLEGQEDVDTLDGYGCGFLLEAGPGHIDEDAGDVAELEGEGQAELVDELGAQGDIVDGDVARDEADVHVVLDAVEVLAEVLDQQRLHDGGEHAYNKVRRYCL